MPLDEIFDAAMRRFLERRRVDMRSLAVELGMGRATLYRRVGSRDQLLGQVLWQLTQRSLQRAVKHAEGRRGADRILAVIGNFLAGVIEQPSLRHFLAAEPEAALRILTSKHGVVQPGVRAHLEGLLQEEIAAGTFIPGWTRGPWPSSWSASARASCTRTRSPTANQTWIRRCW